MYKQDILTDFENERRQKSAFYAVLLLFSLATIVNCWFYVIPSLLKYPFRFHLKSFNSYFSVAVRIILPIAGLFWFFQKRQQGWTTLAFLTTFGLFHIVFWAVRLLLMGGTMTMILKQILMVVLVVLTMTLYFLIKRELLEYYQITERNKLYSLFAGLTLAILFNLKIFTVG